MEEKMEEEYQTIIVRYGIGYGTHDLNIEVPANATDYEIEEEVMQAVMERVDYDWDRA
jgi:hypothetical protein